MNLNQRTHEATCYIPVIPRTFFPYLVKVIATDTCFPIDFEARGLLFETGEVVIEYPFKDQNGNGPTPGDDGTAIDIHTVVLPSGEELGKEGWKEVTVAPGRDRRLLASLSMMSDAAFAYGEGEGTSLFEQIVQAKVNVHKLAGLPYDVLLAQLGISDPSPAQTNEGQATLDPSIYVMPSLIPSGRFIIDQDRRKVAEMFQPGDSPAEMEAIKSRIVRSFNTLPDLVGVLMRADNEGGIWQALYNEGITDAYDAALKSALEALGEAGIADIAHRYELDLESLLAKLGK